MKVRIPLILPAALLLTTGCITSLRVSTEVYEGPLPADPVPANAARVGALTQTALKDYGVRAVETATDTYGNVIARLAEKYPDFIDRQFVGEFRESFRVVAKDAVAPAVSSAETARSLAQQLSAISCPATTETKSDCDAITPSDVLIEQWTATLRSKLLETGRLGRVAIQKINDSQAAQVRRLLESNFRRTDDASIARLRTLTNMPVGTAAQRSAAAAAAIAQAEAITRDLLAADDSVLASLLVAQPLSVQAAATQIIPLEDPAVRMILTQSETNPKVWKKYVNDVVSNNQFGNAEIAFRMDGLGDSHIKGVMFDASQAMKAGFSVLAKTVEATATAFGGASFAPEPKKATDTTATEDELTPGTTPAASKPAIDAEVARLASAASMRRDTMESLFWDATTIGKALPADADAAAADAAKKLLALVKCAQDEITDPKGRRCGGEE